MNFTLPRIATPKLAGNLFGAKRQPAQQSPWVPNQPPQPSQAAPQQPAPQQPAAQPTQPPVSSVTATPPPNPQAATFQLTRQPSLTPGYQMAEDQNNKGLATGQFADVQSARGATDRANALRTSGALQAARGTVGRAPGDFSPEAALRAQDQAMSAAEGQNLNASNGVNQLQRQYRNDALNRAGDFEANAETAANGERNYLTGRADTTYNRGYQQSQDATTLSKWNLDRTDKLGQQGIDNAYKDKVFNENTHEWEAANTQTVEATKRKNALDYIDSLPPGPAKTAAYAKYMNGEDPSQISGEIVNPATGMINDGTNGTSNYVGPTQAQLAVKSMTDEIGSLHPEWSQEQVAAEVQRRRIANDAATTAPVTTATDTQSAKAVKDKISLGKALGPEDLAIAKTQNLIPSVASSGGGSDVILGGGAAAYLQEHPDGNLLMDGALVKLVRGYKAGSLSLAEIKANGTSYYIDNKGRWYAQPVVQNSRSMPPTIPNPLKGST